MSFHPAETLPVYTSSREPPSAEPPEAQLSLPHAGECHRDHREPRRAVERERVLGRVQRKPPGEDCSPVHGKACEPPDRGVSGRNRNEGHRERGGLRTWINRLRKHCCSGDGDTGM